MNHTTRVLVTTSATTLSLLGFCGSALATEPTDPPAQYVDFTGTEQTVVVPDGVSAVAIWASGGAGAAGSDGHDCGTPLTAGGGPGVVTGTLAVSPGQVLTVSVGGAGSTAGCGGATTSAGGWGGDASGGDGVTSHDNGSSGGGGGATTITRGNELVLVAAGGGGGSVAGPFTWNAGYGVGGTGGLSYVDDDAGPAVLGGGAGGDGHGDGHGHGGAVGTLSNATTGSPGAPGQVGHDDGGDSGAGGGGWGGGAAGTAGALGGGSGGGGGAGFTFANDLPSATFSAGDGTSGNGQVVLNWES